MVKKIIELETDYLIIGGGAMCMAFVDEMLNGSCAYGKSRSSEHLERKAPAIFVTFKQYNK